MEAQEYLAQRRDAYVDHYRGAVESLRARGVECETEVWVRPGVKPGEQALPHPICVDIIAMEAGERKMVMVSDMPANAPLRCASRLGAASLKVYDIHWEALPLWVRIPDPNWQELDPWRSKWMNIGNTPLQGELRGEVHYFGSPVAEGGGFMFEMDFGSAPLEALNELLELLVKMGATEIELGRSDGSDLPAKILQGLKNPDLSLPQLTVLAAEVLSTLPEVQHVEISNSECLSITAAGQSKPFLAYTANLYRLLMRTGLEARPQEMNRFLRGQRESMGPKVVPELSQLSVVIKDNRFLANFRQMPGIKMPLCYPLVADLWVMCVWDAPNGMRFTTDEEPEKYGMTREQMIDRARSNFLARRAPVELSKHGPLIVAQTRDCYDASLLLDEKWIGEMAGKVQGDLLACVPARHVVLLGGSQNPATVSELRNAAERIEKGGDHLISGTILIRRANAWEAYSPPSGPAPASQQPAASREKRAWWKFW